ncbi:uncharacterized protein CLUP02_08849 [Colletotrichum lupini]|uniref:Uncharacterized protein n=1 Tax=Colletotrichum lupini TaxID=145971 RepID=A0A9Q8STJ4_9PEZI|nr:uncharacterized protein CLUP02_08849 [Colletotrichum lupini]UQC83354.1 hypothetical protein CLUP02_08849 [Colletotrichum lupini]
MSQEASKPTLEDRLLDRGMIVAPATLLTWCPAAPNNTVAFLRRSGRSWAVCLHPSPWHAWIPTQVNPTAEKITT